MAAPNLTLLEIEPTIEIVTVTPTLATEWLATNHVNRKLRSRDVEKYARDMTAGRWSMTGEPIKFSASGRLLDGQHRLSAIIRSGVEVKLLVVRNVEDRAQIDMDSGVKRSAADALGFNGEGYAPMLAAAARLIILYTSGRINQESKSRTTSHGEIVDFVVDNPDIREAIAAGNTWHNAIDAPPSVICTAFFVLSQIHQSQATAFFEALASRTGLSHGSPILALDSRLRNIRKVGLRVEPKDYLGLFFKAWNYWRKNRAIAQLMLGGGIPVPR